MFHRCHIHRTIVKATPDKNAPMRAREMKRRRMPAPFSLRPRYIVSMRRRSMCISILRLMRCNALSMDFTRRFKPLAMSW